MKVLINYKKDNQGKKFILNVQTLYTTDDIDFEIVEVSKYCDINKLTYDRKNKLIEDKEKLELQKIIEEMAETIVNEEFDKLMNEEI